MHNTALWTSFFIICTAMLELAHTEEYSYRDDFKLENITRHEKWLTNTEMTKENINCYDVINPSNRIRRRGLPKMCWEATWADTKLKFRCTVKGSSKTDWVKINIDGAENKTCQFDKLAGDKDCQVEITHLDYFNNKTFSCEHKYSYKNTDYILDAFILQDIGVPDKPEFRQAPGNANLLQCSVQKLRVNSVLSIMSSKNNHTVVNQNHGQSELTFEVTQEDMGQEFECSHKYPSGKTSNTIILIKDGKAPESSTIQIKAILYAVIIIVIVSCMCLVFYIICKCCNEEKATYRPDESISDDPFVTPTPKVQRPQSAEYAVPIPKNQRKENSQYAMVIPKTKRFKDAEPAYADPLDMEPDQPYMEIGSALYASINGSSLYAEIGSAEPPYVNGDICRNNRALDDEESIQSVQYSSLMFKDRTYANTDRTYANAGAMGISQNTPEQLCEPVYSAVKPEKPTLAPKPRKKPNETSGYVSMR